MPRRRKKTVPPTIHLSAGPLPLRLSERFAGHLLVFSDASQRRQGGLAAVIFSDSASEPLVATCSVPLTGSNELELQAALFALQQARQHFPERPAALFSDNQDAVLRLNRAIEQGLAQAPELAQMLGNHDIDTALNNMVVHWIKGHSTCRGNALADQHAATAAS